MHYFVAIGKLKWTYSQETRSLGQNRRFFVPWDLEIRRMTLKKAPLICYFKLCISFESLMWIQTGVKVRKRLNGGLTSVTLSFDLWPCTFAWTSLLSLVITPENFMMIRWWKLCEKGVTDGRIDGRTGGRADRLKCFVRFRTKDNK